ncbi:hypothetical protein C5167_021062 [Papaver somniferum]|uniref:Uncharacterized protein n=1 Tax=Papaver somniferum TaxID=3469 RepID=A0A4Y7IUU5_PAPSO|nr:hypothetical protein C5167_021062 [Papaver somniferum]
MGKDLGKGANL